jgi:hypothetical protein
MTQARKLAGRMIIAVAAALSCSTPIVMQPFTLCDNYKTANLSKRPLIVSLPGEKGIIVENPKDVVDDFGGMNASPESRLTKFYLPLFEETFTSFLSGDSVIAAGAGQGDFFNTLPKRHISLKIGHDTGSLIFSLPTKTAMQTAGFDSAVVVLIDRMTFKRNNFYIEYYWDDKTKRSANLEADAKLLIWDYKMDAPVFYGTVTQKIEFQIAMQRKHWDESARALAKKIVFSAKCL